MDPNKDIIKFLLDLIFPSKPYCFLCNRKLDRASIYICQTCIDNIMPLSGPFCKKCGKPLSIEKHVKNNFCIDCQIERHVFVQARSYGRYEGNLKKIINEYKYHGKRQLAEVLGAKMYELLIVLPWPQIDFLVPMPLHIRRLRERGFNQAYFLADILAERSGIPLFTGLERIKPTEHQTLLDKASRKKNLYGAFRVKNPSKILDKTLILVDDVYTTGTTAGEKLKTF